MTSLNTQKRPSAEVQYDNKIEAPVIDHKNIPMIKFLREKGEKKIAEKRSLRRSQAAGVLLNVSGKGKGVSGKGDRGSGNSKGSGGTAGPGSGSGSGSGSTSSSVKVTSTSKRLDRFILLATDMCLFPAKNRTQCIPLHYIALHRITLYRNISITIYHIA